MGKDLNLEELTMEQYVPITNYEGLYEISNFGNVRALPRYNTDKNGKVKFYPGKNLIPDILERNHTSYARVTLSKHGITKKYQLHRLVAKHFIAPGNPDQDQINHIDNNGLNNHYTNLEWVTGSENMQHSQNQGRLFHASSAGGTASGRNRRDAIIEKIQESIGTTIRNFLILSYEGFSKLRYRVKVQCTRCNEISTLDTQHLNSPSKEKGKARCNCCRNVKDENLEKWLLERNKI
jgi:hypothetical protein